MLKKLLAEAKQCVAGSGRERGVGVGGWVEVVVTVMDVWLHSFKKVIAIGLWYFLNWTLLPLLSDSLRYNITYWEKKEDFLYFENLFVIP